MGVCSVKPIRPPKAATELSKFLPVLAGLAFFHEIGGKVIFASSRRLPWVRPVACENQTLCCMQRRLCFGDAFVYRTCALWQVFQANKPILAANMPILRGNGCEC